MATTIVPSVGQGVCFTAQGAGTTPGYSAIDVRRAALEGAQEGVVAVTSTEAGGWRVTQKGSGANMSVDIAANVACARVQGDTVTQQGLYTVAPHSAVINETITAADATNPRIDQVILEVLDNVHDASGSSLARTRVVAGSPTGGATLDNRSGAAALPSNAVTLADVLVGAGVSTIPNNKIRDRRPWARGAQSYSSAVSAALITSTVAVVEDTTLKKRIECSGVQCEVTVSAWVTQSAGTDIDLHVYLDGVATRTWRRAVPSTGSQWISRGFTTPVAGSHQLSIALGNVSGAGTATIGIADGARPTEVYLREIVAQNLANNTVTSG